MISFDMPCYYIKLQEFNLSDFMVKKGYFFKDTVITSFLKNNYAFPI